ncbi:hypothetical protein Q8F55_007420 [Vanrija albida]|uniref:Uncharacterized protein n=1 Tax=Vanrija albida TaxID=181172 RepID=A0ABR3PTG4_9TREE
MPDGDGSAAGAEPFDVFDTVACWLANVCDTCAYVAWCVQFAALYLLLIFLKLTLSVIIGFLIFFLVDASTDFYFFGRVLGFDYVFRSPENAPPDPATLPFILVSLLIILATLLSVAYKQRQATIPPATERIELIHREPILVVASSAIEPTAAPHIWSTIIKYADPETRAELRATSSDLRDLHDVLLFSPVFTTPVVLESSARHFKFHILQDRLKKLNFGKQKWKHLFPAVNTDSRRFHDLVSRFSTVLNVASVITIQGRLDPRLRTLWPSPHTVPEFSIVRYALDAFDNPRNYVFTAHEQEVYFLSLLKQGDVIPTWFTIGKQLTAPKVVFNINFNPNLNFKVQAVDIEMPRLAPTVQEVTFIFRSKPSTVAAPHCVLPTSTTPPAAPTSTSGVFAVHKECELVPVSLITCFAAVVFLVQKYRTLDRVFNFVALGEGDTTFFDLNVLNLPTKAQSVTQMQNDFKRHVKGAVIFNLILHGLSSREAFDQANQLGHQHLNFMTMEQFKTRVGKYQFRVAAVK